MACAFGLLAGVGGFTFYYAQGLSYLSDDPKVCVNCHIMRDYYDSWQKAGHHTAAKCTDCHLPHDIVRKYYIKSENGFLHSKAFTLQNFHEPIQIRKSSREIVIQNCYYCHKDFVCQTAIAAKKELRLDCIRCHGDAGHGPTK